MLVHSDMHAAHRASAKVRIRFELAHVRTPIYGDGGSVVVAVGFERTNRRRHRVMKMETTFVAFRIESNVRARTLTFIMDMRRFVVGYYE